MKMLRLLFLSAVLLAAVHLACARPVRFPPYQELLDKCDLVVIAAPTNTVDTKERIDLPGVSVGHADKTATGLPVIGQETKFRVSAVLKGDQTLKDFILHHYRETARSSLPVVNGVMLVTFDPSKPGSFLLFLVREPDGRYAPFDQTDPGLISVQPLKTNTKDSTGKPTGL